jgi:hypothetical protein
MKLHPDWNEFFDLLERHGVRFLVVGGFAVAAHGHPRYTADIDIFIARDPRNAARVAKAVRDFGFASVTGQQFEVPYAVLFLGQKPFRIDILNTISGVSFDTAWKRRIRVKLGTRPLPIIAREHLVKNKRASGRAKDLADLEALRHIQPANRRRR